MNELRARELFADSLKESLSPADAAALADFLSRNPALRAEFESAGELFTRLEQEPLDRPGDGVRQALQAAIAAERTSNPAPQEASRPAAARNPFGRLLIPSFAAAALLVALGFYLGLNVGQATIVPSPTPDLAANRNTPMEPVVTADDSDSTPSTIRLERVLAQSAAGPVDAASLPGLLKALTDSSPNIRISALQALYQYAAAPEVRATVSARIDRDPSVLVQIAMIDFITAAGGVDAAPRLKTLSQNESIDSDVRDAASYALAQL